MANLDQHGGEPIPRGAALARAVHEKYPAQALELGIGLLLGAPGGIRRPGGLSEDMVLVEGDLCPGQVLGDAADVAPMLTDSTAFGSAP